MWDFLTIVFPRDNFLTISQATQMYIVCKCYTLGKLMYQLKTLGFTKQLAFHLLGSILGYTVFKSMV